MLRRPRWHRARHQGWRLGHDARSSPIPSPESQSTRPAGKAIDILLLHYTGMRDAEAALERLCDPRGQGQRHYLIDEDGTIYRLVAEDAPRLACRRQLLGRRARHQRASRSASSWSIPATRFGYRAFPEAQMAALVDLGEVIVARHPHSRRPRARSFRRRAAAQAGSGRAVRLGPAWRRPGSASGRRQRPRRGGPASPSCRRCATLRLRRSPTSGSARRGDARGALAFQRHFRPALIDGQPDAETAALLAGCSIGLIDEASVASA